MPTFKNSLLKLKYKNVHLCFFKEQLRYISIRQILDDFVLQIGLHPKNILNFPQKSFSHARWNELHLVELWRKSNKHSEWRIM